MANKPSRQNALLAALQRQPTASHPPHALEPEAALRPAALAAPRVSEVPVKTAAKTKTRVGKPVQFWLHEEDRKLIREISAWLAGQGIRPSDSMVVRAALRMVKTGPGLLEAYRQAVLLDGRFKAR